MLASAAAGGCLIFVLSGMALNGSVTQPGVGMCSALTFIQFVLVGVIDDLKEVHDVGVLAHAQDLNLPRHRGRQGSWEPQTG